MTSDKEPNIQARRSERESVCEFLCGPRVQEIPPKDIARKIWRGVHLGLPDNDLPLLPEPEPKAIDIDI